MHLLGITVITLLVVVHNEAAPVSANLDPIESETEVVQHRTSHLHKRQFDLSVEASFEETLGAELGADLSGNIWRNEEGTARLDGSATYSQHFNTIGGGGLVPNGNARTGISFRYHHD